MDQDHLIPYMDDIAEYIEVSTHQAIVLVYGYKETMIDTKKDLQEYHVQIKDLKRFNLLLHKLANEIQKSTNLVQGSTDSNLDLDLDIKEISECLRIIEARRIVFEEEDGDSYTSVYVGDYLHLDLESGMFYGVANHSTKFMQNWNVQNMLNYSHTSKVNTFTVSIRDTIGSF